MVKDFRRRIVQVVSSIAINGNLKGFKNGTIYKGNFKKICVPGLNCYSCPGAMGSCPIGSMQAVIGSIRYNVSYYVLGFASLFGILFGRLICGWVCPFGLIQELLHKIPFPKIKVSSKVNNVLKYLKYVILAVFVIILPLGAALLNDLGNSDPYFCKLICPAGTLEGGIPLVLSNKELRGAIGFLFAWKVSLLIIIIFLSMSVYRVFCRYICPLGAFYSLFNPISFYSFKVNKSKCVSCNKCTNACKLDIKVYENPNSRECIRCGECIKTCPKNAISKGFRHKALKCTFK
ncbi:4Fe-4S binding protein [Clostridium tagluense]|uniref:4Fe-4S binding protein n=1 Tax=Clostridium tagluense TaxID=360422 RepID=UPI001C0D5CD2|nr:4Fe-4S binding protein [Clostridium tagluense]MBU3126884.1 4Fe-4S binding protein [Clostridium tagluense]MCB2310558.1 4Fe-4S binding protein [Clostridium tagluense]MCB2315276.1 4Fe-4S binding protein [Clostridium tagluense]MCB2320127.1 4Fe-4S binding protein [Clostridium tagluense]MCB2325018.1 4Fe-4S binding protein [Clostridium tagluense]